MPTRPRMYVSGVPAHIVQRGNNREATFFCDNDYQFYLATLQEGLGRYSCELHAYCLMTNHVHLLITPAAPDGIPRLMQHLGRHKSSLVQADDYLFATQRYIEMNPVAAGMITSPSDYKWSSHLCNAHGQLSALITPHPLYRSLGRTSSQRQTKYRGLFQNSLIATNQEKIRKSLDANYPIGNERFNSQIEEALGRKIG